MTIQNPFDRGGDGPLQNGRSKDYISPAFECGGYCIELGILELSCYKTARSGPLGSQNSMSPLVGPTSNMLNTRRLSLVISVRCSHPFPWTFSILLRDANSPSGVRLPMFRGLSEGLILLSSATSAMRLSISTFIDQTLQCGHIRGRTRE